MSTNPPIHVPDRKRLFAVRAVSALVVFLGLCGETVAAEMGFLDCMIRPGRVERTKLQPEGRIEAARGEWEPLQVVLRGEAKELGALGMSVIAPANAAGEKLAASWTLFRGDYVRVGQSTEFAPLPPGEYVDPLVPIPKGAPLLMPGKKEQGEINQPVWIDFHIAGEAQPGLYRGEVVIQGPGGA